MLSCPVYYSRTREPVGLRHGGRENTKLKKEGCFHHGDGGARRTRMRVARVACRCWETRVVALHVHTRAQPSRAWQVE
jgi:hypothetical protein